MILGDSKPRINHLNENQSFFEEIIDPDRDISIY